MLTLVMDTAAGAAVGLVRDGTVVAAARHRSVREHAERLQPLIAAVLDQAGVRLAAVDLMVVGTGPAPYTGLRAGIVTARVLARAAGREVCGISPLDALARQAFLAGASGQVLVATDARRQEVYYGLYEAAGEDVHRVGELGVARPGELTAVAAAAAAVVGGGLGLYASPLEGRGPAVSELDLGVMAGMAAARYAAGRPGDIEPAYLRRPDVHLGT